MIGTTQAADGEDHALWRRAVFGSLAPTVYFYLTFAVIAIGLLWMLYAVRGRVDDEDRCWMWYPLWTPFTIVLLDTPLSLWGVWNDKWCHGLTSGAWTDTSRNGAGLTYSAGTVTRSEHKVNKPLKEEIGGIWTRTPRVRDSGVE